jgi:hypothetical protein
MAPSKRVLFKVVGALVALCAVVLLTGTWWISSLYQSEQTDMARASAAFAEVRARFPGLEPAFQIQETRLVVMREPAAAPAPPAAAHMLVWQPRERTLSRVTLPLWMSKVATEPLPLEALAGVADQGVGAIMNAKRRGHELNIRLNELQRYGRTLLLDGVTADGKHIMMWNE